ncbi:DUF6542 domain-containing protein [Amycolatopsis cihanbeyliensis]|uniref:DUF6542 domain-containing protein n=1 Tax=Amycolatopsis cihanbeyliensis TaxID=1128664 RepID=A0A542DHP5_AMYCI|nr:DUF6542 domain-containing protein [Amycolatopsis cihanbeyliensis]TQJ02603.1 hypothetical protein FB471_2336 [Amycolatopsis cihanbeyliensis]
MTATRDRQYDREAEEGSVPWDERPVVGDRRGLPWWAAVLLAFGLAIAGAVINLQVQDELGLLFQGCYFVGAVTAVGAVRRRNLFGPMVQPPLILGITVPAVVLFASGQPSGSDTLAKVLAISTPLINGFPTMAVTTGATLLIGLFRIYRERDPYAPVKARSGKRKEGATRSTDKAGAGERDAPDRKGRPPRDKAGQAKPPRDKAARDRPATGKPPQRGQGERKPPEGRPPEGRPAEGRPAAPRKQGPPQRGNPPNRAGGPQPGGNPKPGGGQQSGGSPKPGGGAGRAGGPSGGRGPRNPADPGAPGPRQPRQPGGDGPDRRRGGGRPDAPPGGGRPRRTPPRPDDPPQGGPDAPRRGGRPARGRPWDDGQS